MSPEERTEYDSILHRKEVDKLYHITNGELPEMDELEELSMLIVRADPKDSNHYPFWVAEVGKIDKDRNSPNFNMVQVCWYTPIRQEKMTLQMSNIFMPNFQPNAALAWTQGTSNQATRQSNEWQIGLTWTQ